MFLRIAFRQFYIYIYMLSRIAIRHISIYRPVSILSLLVFLLIMVQVLSSYYFIVVCQHVIIMISFLIARDVEFNSFTLTFIITMAVAPTTIFFIALMSAFLVAFLAARFFNNSPTVDFLNRAVTLGNRSQPITLLLPPLNRTITRLSGAWGPVIRTRPSQQPLLPRNGMFSFHF